MDRKVRWLTLAALLYTTAAWAGFVFDYETKTCKELTPAEFDKALAPMKSCAVHVESAENLGILFECEDRRYIFAKDKDTCLHLWQIEQRFLEPRAKKSRVKGSV